MYFVTQNVMFPITFLHMICQETSFFFPVRLAASEESLHGVAQESGIESGAVINHKPLQSLKILHLIVTRIFRRGGF